MQAYSQIFSLRRPVHQCPLQILKIAALLTLQIPTGKQPHPPLPWLNPFGERHPRPVLHRPEFSAPGSRQVLIFQCKLPQGVGQGAAVRDGEAGGKAAPCPCSVKASGTGDVVQPASGRCATASGPGPSPPLPHPSPQAATDTRARGHTVQMIPPPYAHTSTDLHGLACSQEVQGTRRTDRSFPAPAPGPGCTRSSCGR